MVSHWMRNELFTYLYCGFISWIVFLISFLFLTGFLINIMNFELSSIWFLIIGLFCLLINYLVFRIILFSKSTSTDMFSNPIHNYHMVIKGLERIFRIIVILVTLGLIASMSTVMMLSMAIYTSQSIEKYLYAIPLLLIVYLLFAVPSFYGIREINRLRLLLHEFDIVKSDIRKQMISPTKLELIDSSDTLIKQ